MAAPEPQLAGSLGWAVHQIDADEGEAIVRWLRVHATVGMLDLYRNDVRRQGLAVPCAHNKGDTRVFVGTAFAAQAMKFFGPLRDGAKRTSEGAVASHRRGPVHRRRFRAWLKSS